MNTYKKFSNKLRVQLVDPINEISDRHFFSDDEDEDDRYLLEFGDKDENEDDPEASLYLDDDDDPEASYYLDDDEE